MSGAALAVAAVAAVVGTGYAIHSGEQQKAAQSKAQEQAKQAAAEQAKIAREAAAKQEEAANAQNAIAKSQLDLAKKNAQQQEEQINRANAKSPDIAGMLSANQNAAKGGQSGTMLTGPQGVDPNSLNLGKNTLLGS